MSITFKIKKTTQPGIKGGGKVKYIAQIVYSGVITDKEFIEAFRQATRIEHTEIAKRYYMTFQHLLYEFLSNGKVVRMTWLGSFFPRIKSKKNEKENNVVPSSIEKVDAFFRPNNYFKDKMQKTTLIKEKPKGKKIIVEI